MNIRNIFLQLRLLLFEIIIYIVQSIISTSDKGLNNISIKKLRDLESSIKEMLLPEYSESLDMKIEKVKKTLSDLKPFKVRKM